jgi:hypothetical protein
MPAMQAQAEVLITLWSERGVTQRITNGMVLRWRALSAPE